jgi:signal peptidase I
VSPAPTITAPHVGAGQRTSLRHIAKHVTRRAAVLVLWVALGAGATFLAAGAASTLLGFRILAVFSGSMAPAIETGDVVVDERIGPLDANVGDIVTFRDPHGSRLITHRVRRVRWEGEWIKFTTKGDINNNVESWKVPADGSIGRVRFRLPRVGYAAAWVGSPIGRILLVVIPALLLAAFELRRIWFPAAKEQRGARTH